MRIVRRLFVVLLADNNHGKTSIMRSLLSQAEGGYAYQPNTSWPRKGERKLWSPWGRPIFALAFPRSYQETEKYNYSSVVDALDGNDKLWRSRELIIMPSHVSDIADSRNTLDDIDQMIAAGQSSGFDVICASVIFNKNNIDQEFDFWDLESYADIWQRRWDARMTIPNKWFDDTTEGNKYYFGQLDALGRDLWVWISKAMEI